MDTGGNVGNKRHKQTVSIRKDSWRNFGGSPEIYILVVPRPKTIPNQTSDGNKCQHSRRLGLFLLRDMRSAKIGGAGKIVQIDESKVGKRKYHRGHRVEGQWVFGGIEAETRKCYLVPVKDRSESTLMRIIKKWIEPGSLIVSDCWKSYGKLSQNGYTHETVNHSEEFVNEKGFHINKQDGHWRQMKTTLPIFRARKEHFSSSLAEFMWRYKHKNSNTFKIFLRDVKELAYKVE